MRHRASAYLFQQGFLLTEGAWMQGLEIKWIRQLPGRSPWLQLLWSDVHSGLRQPGAARKVLHYPFPQSESKIQRFELILPIYSRCRPAGTWACLCPLNLLFPSPVIFHFAPLSICSPDLLQFILGLCEMDLILPEPHHYASACNEATHIYARDILSYYRLYAWECILQTQHFNTVSLPT